MEYSRGPEKVWVYGALRVREGHELTLTAPSRNTAGYLRLLEAMVDLRRLRGDLYAWERVRRGGSTMPKSHAPYPPEDRAEAIRLVRSSGQPVAQSARQVEVCSATLRLWVRQAAIDEGRRPDGPTTEQTEEVRRLHRAVKARREEREILFNL